MCLLIQNEHKNVLTAEEDLIFYKVVKLFDKKKYYSYFQLDEIVFGELKEAEDKDEFAFRTSASVTHPLLIEEGGYHLFCSYDDAVRFARESYKFKYTGTTEIKVVKAIVPKGTKYVVGQFITYFGELVDSVVAKAVRYEKL